MYGCSEPHLIYGWRQNDDENSIANEWLWKNNVKGYTVEIVRNHAVEFVYGVKCDVDETTGIPTVSDRAKANVQKAHAKSGSTEKIGFFLAMSGDFDSQHKDFTPGEHRAEPSPEDEEDEEDEEDDEEPSPRGSKRARL